MQFLRWSSILLLCLFMTITTFPAYAATITVDTTADGVSGCSLREAIQSANNNNAGSTGCTAGSGADIIELTVSGSYTLTSGSALPVTSPITIQESAGVTAIIEAATSANAVNYRVFNVSGASASLTLDGITVRHGGSTSANLAGGCINATSSASLSLINGSVVELCRTSGNGGGIFQNLGGNLVLNGATIENNRSGGSGGGVFSADGTINITDTVFADNIIQASGGQPGGGALHVNGVGTPASITGATFTDNRVSGGTINNRGGAIYKSGGGTLSISDSVFTNNSVSGTSAQGGAIYNNGGGVIVTTSVIQTNTAATNGGAYHSTGNTDSITGSCVVNNGDTAVFDMGGSVTTATDNWWGNSWGPRITGAPAGSGSFLSKGDSISGNGTSFVNVGLISAGPGNTTPSGDWMLTAPTIAGVTCLSCAGPSSNGDSRYCEHL